MAVYFVGAAMTKASAAVEIFSDSTKERRPKKNMREWWRRRNLNSKLRLRKLRRRKSRKSLKLMKKRRKMVKFLYRLRLGFQLKVKQESWLKAHLLRRENQLNRLKRRNSQKRRRWKTSTALVSSHSPLLLSLCGTIRLRLLPKLAMPRATTHIF